VPTIEVDSHEIAGLDDLVDRLVYLGILMQEIGEELVDNTECRFETSSASDAKR